VVAPLCNEKRVEDGPGPARSSCMAVAGAAGTDSSCSSQQASTAAYASKTFLTKRYADDHGNKQALPPH